MSKPSADLFALQRGLSENAEGCEVKTLDMRFLEFLADEEEMSLMDHATGTKHLFKAIDNPKNPAQTHAVRQLCAKVGVPYSFFMDNRPPFRSQVVNSWIKSLAPKEGIEFPFTLFVRESKDLSVIRAVTDPSYAAVPLEKAVLLLSEGYPKPDMEVWVDLTEGTEKDSLIFHTRIIYNDETVGSEYVPGISVVMSDLAAMDMTVDAFLYHPGSQTYLVAQYGGQPMIKFQHYKMQPSDILEVLRKLPARMMEELPRYLDSLKNTELVYPGVDRACVLLSGKSGLPKKFRRAVHLEAQDSAEIMQDLPGFLIQAGQVAKNFDSSDRLKIERALGSFAGMSYGKLKNLTN